MYKPVINTTARKLVSIQKILNVEPCPNSDNLDIVQVLGWKVVTQKGEFKKDDLALYFEIDSFIPLTSEVENLRKYSYKKHPDTGEEGLRIRTIRLRAQVSQGLILPLSLYGVEGNEGDDLTERLGVSKYEVIERISLEAKGRFPFFIPKTDEVRIQSAPYIIEKYKDVPCYSTEKIDGMSATYFVNKGEYGVCSRNLDLKLLDKNPFYRLGKMIDIETKLRSVNRNIASQGEMYGITGGKGIRGNKLDIKGLRFAMYNVYLIDETRYMNLDEMLKLSTDLEIPTVPILGRFNLPSNMDDLVSMATKKSAINPEKWQEGIVVRPVNNIIDPEFSMLAGSNGTGYVSFKVMNPEFLIKYEE